MGVTIRVPVIVPAIKCIECGAPGAQWTQFVQGYCKCCDACMVKGGGWRADSGKPVCYPQPQVVSNS